MSFVCEREVVSDRACEKVSVRARTERVCVCVRVRDSLNESEKQTDCIIIESE